VCCSYFADPFAGFNGTERFKRNVSNLGGGSRLLLRQCPAAVLCFLGCASALKPAFYFMFCATQRQAGRQPALIQPNCADAATWVLGAGMMQDINLSVTSFEEQEQQVITKWRFSATLDLPWKPILAAAGGTTHVFDPVSGWRGRWARQQVGGQVVGWAGCWKGQALCALQCSPCLTRLRLPRWCLCNNRTRAWW